MGEIWNQVFLEPTLNGLIVLYSVLFSNFGLTIIAFTIFIRLITIPLTLRQLKATKAMTALQPRLLEMQRKYAKNKQKLAQEQMKLYKEVGMNPMGCLWPMVVQMPVWIALYQAILQALATTPQDLLNFSTHLYSWSVVSRTSPPLEEQFLWLNLDRPDRLMVLPILVGASMWVQQKMITNPAADPRQQSMNRMMLWTMPLMFGLFTISFPSGLGIYWVMSNLVGIIIQYFISGWGELLPSRSPEKRDEHARPFQRQDRRGSDSAGPKATGRKPRSGGDNSAPEGQNRHLRPGG